MTEGAAGGLAYEDLVPGWNRTFPPRTVSREDIVRFARESNVGLDFTTPPRRPDPRESAKRMLDILDR